MAVWQCKSAHSLAKRFVAKGVRIRIQQQRMNKHSLKNLIHANRPAVAIFYFLYRQYSD